MRKHDKGDDKEGDNDKGDKKVTGGLVGEVMKRCRGGGGMVPRKILPYRAVTLEPVGNTNQKGNAGIHKVPAQKSGQIGLLRFGNALSCLFEL